MQLVVVKLPDHSVVCSVGSHSCSKLTDSQSEGYDRDYYAYVYLKSGC